MTVSDRTRDTAIFQLYIIVALNSIKEELRIHKQQCWEIITRRWEGELKTNVDVVNIDFIATSIVYRVAIVESCAVCPTRKRHMVLPMFGHLLTLPPYPST